mgnify:CR=1 FL=1
MERTVIFSLTPDIPVLKQQIPLTIKSIFTPAAETCNQAIGEDATAVFNMLSGYSEPLFWNKLSLAPLWLRDKSNLFSPLPQKLHTKH